MSITLTGYRNVEDYWKSNQFRGLKWSGKDGPPNLMNLLIKHVRAQSFSSNDLLINRKSFQCREVVTDDHGTGMKSEVIYKFSVLMIDARIKSM